MNCFPCRGPACNSCGKFDRINAAVVQGNDLSCPRCHEQHVDLDTGRCRSCGFQVVKPPGTSQQGTSSM